MEKWDKKLLHENVVYDVWEAEDNELEGKIAPVSHGFVNLYIGTDWIDFCGVSWAKDYLVDKDYKPRCWTKEKVDAANASTELDDILEIPESDK